MVKRIGLALLLAGTSLAAHAQDRAALLAQHSGGTLKLSANAAGGSIDPQVNYTNQYWPILWNTNDGLVAYKKTSGPASNELTPDLAEAIPTPQDGGTTYVFKLREGIKFSTGKEVTTNDVVASFQRIFKVSSPTAGTFFNVIVGADKCLADGAGAGCTLEGGVIGDAKARTVTFHLTHPDSEFLLKLGVPHAYVLPADSPPKDVGTVPLPATGPYMIASYNPESLLKLVRNPMFKEWSVEAQPAGFPDAIEYSFGMEPEAQVTAVERSQFDWLFDPPPTDRLAELGSTYGKRLKIEQLQAMYFLPMNVNLPPFDNIKARQAVNYAINRRSAVNLFGGPNLASPSCQILPPGLPGHQDYCPYTVNPGATWSAPDMAKAKQLVKESGTAGQKVTLVVADSATTKAIGTYVQSVLRELGYDASVQSLSENTQFTYIQNTNNKVQISLTEWYPDYPAASDFLNVLFSCASFHPGTDSSVNISGWCDKPVNAEMERALATAVTDPAAANEMWAKIDREVTDAAVVAVLFTPKHLDLLSERVGNFVFSNQYNWVYSQSWVR